MQAHSELRNLPPVLREMFTRGRPQYERAVRGIHWGDAGIYVVSSTRSLPAALLAAYAFEDLLACPVAVREVSSFLAHSLGALRTGSVVVLISSEAPETLDAARAATRRGAQLLALVPASSPVAAVAHQVFSLPEVGGAPSSGIAEVCLEHAAVGYLALLAARLVKRPQPSLERLEKEWNEIPDHLDTLTSQLMDGVRASAGALRPAPALFFVGGGYHHASAERAASLAQRRGGCAIPGSDLARFRCDFLANLGQGAGVVFLSGSQSRRRKAVAELAHEAKDRGANVLAVTGSNDHDLIREASFTLLLPDLVELPASILSLALAGWLGRELATPPRETRMRRSGAVDSGAQHPSGRVE
jgi:DNA-binding MurR/RpiR family transcriptional regulator